jgi:hypothetical protein
MLISPKHKLAFIHIPKTGGKSIREALRNDDPDAHHVGKWHIAATTAKEMVDWDDYKSFAVVRNPWERVVSAYTFAAKDRMDLEAFLNSQWPDYLQPQMHWLVDHEGNVIVNCVCRYETLDDDFDVLCPGVTLPHLNDSDHAPYRSYYNDLTRMKVLQLFQKDIEAFGYTF